MERDLPEGGCGAGRKYRNIVVRAMAKTSTCAQAERSSVDREAACATRRSCTSGFFGGPTAFASAAIMSDGRRETW